MPQGEVRDARIVRLEVSRARRHRLLQLGVLLFLIGLLNGFVVYNLPNPRMGLASHLEALMNGMFLCILGMIWPNINLSPLLSTWLFWLALYGTYANWIATQLAAVWGAGGGFMKLAGAGMEGTAIQEKLISFLLVSLSLAMVAVCVLVLLGLKIERD